MVIFNLSLWKKLTLFQKIICASLILPSFLFVVISLGIIVYTFVPVSYKIPEISIGKEVTILAHGIYDTPASWSQDMADFINATGKSSATALNWNEYAQSIFRCSVDGRRIGREIGQKIITFDNVQRVHLIGHSCGAFVVFGICEGIKEGENTIQVQSTYLDPVSNYGGIFKQFGINHFGSCADYSDTFIDTGDVIPGSNQTMPHSRTFDITSLREKIGYNGNPHLWPVEYYKRLVFTGEQPDSFDMTPRIERK